MYGMVHRAIRQMMLDQLGAAAWAEVERETASGPADMISLCVYDDARTMALLTASARHLGLDMHDALRIFGRYWIRFAEQGAFGSIMDFTGRDLISFITNLDRMHQAVQLAMPDAQVPSFTLLDAVDGRLRVRYRSERVGLEPFVVGLFEGVLERMGEIGVVEHVPSTGSAAEFAITLAQG